MDVDKLRNIVKNKCFNNKYHDSLKFMIHNCNNIEIRDELLKNVFYCDAYLGSKIYMSMCDDREETRQLIDNILIDIKYRAQKILRKVRVLLAYLELDELEDFFEYYMEIEDILTYNEFSYIARNVTYCQMLVFMRAMMNGYTKIGWSMFAKYIKQVYTPDNDEELFALLAELLKCKKYEACSTIMAVIGLSSKMIKLLTEESRQKYWEELVETGLKNNKRFVLYLNLRYGYNENGNNSNVILQNILEDTHFLNGKWSASFLKKLARNEVLTKEQKTIFLLKIGLEEKAARKIVEEERFEVVMLAQSKEKLVLAELLDDRQKLMDYITYTTIDTMQFPFSARERITIRNDASQYDRTREYSIFNEYMEREQEPRKIAYLYFNSIFRYIVNLEYVVEYLENRFALNEKQLKTIFGDYILWGRVCKVNENSVSIRVKNVLTLHPCRMNTNKYWIERDGVKVKLKIKDDFYFKVAYLMKNGSKLNVHFPAFSIEDMRNIESRRHPDRGERV